MLWDGFILMLIVGLSVAGWNVGIVNSWRGPFAILLATIVTQIFYVDFATWIVQQLRLTPEQGIVSGYLLMWCAVEIIAELVLSVVLPFNKKTRPVLLERIAGGGLGLIKGLIIIILPLLVLTAPIKVPQAPKDKSAMENPIEIGIDKSVLIPVGRTLAKGLAPGLGSFVVSTKEPSFTPNFSGTTVLDEPKK